MSAPSPAPLDLNNVQGDILRGLPSKTQTYLFFQIDNVRVKEFRSQLAHLVPLITTTAQVNDDRGKIAQSKKVAAEERSAPPLLELTGINILFSQKGLIQLGINDNIGDTAFNKGMLLDAEILGDPGQKLSNGFDPDWIPAFKQDIHGVILVSGDSHASVALKIAEVGKIFCFGTHNATVHEVLSLVGDVRPGKEKGHEHFGFLDGISQPAVRYVDTNPNPGQETVPQGIILLGREDDVPSDHNVSTRPTWALDGSFLSFRYLFQLVPEFDTFLKQNPIAIPGLPADQGSELLGARLVGRWKSGAPVDLAPTQDDPALGVDPSRNNDFRYAFPDDQQTQTRCPFAAHTRKTNPRADLEDLSNPPNLSITENRRIIRRGIQFGSEVSATEATSGKTLSPRGLLFAAYSSNIVNGFQFIQQSWADNNTFPPKKDPVTGTTVTSGFDPIIGQAPTGEELSLSGTNPNSPDNTLTLPKWVVPKGGEYFFSPSIPALKSTFALAGTSS